MGILGGLALNAAVPIAQRDPSAWEAPYYFQKNYPDTRFPPNPAKYPDSWDFVLSK